MMEIKGKRTEVKVVVILPVLNESHHIEELITRINQVLQSSQYLICMVDDGSTDGTLEIIHSLDQKYPRRIHLIRRKKEIPGCQRGSALNLAMEWALEKTPAQIFIEIDGDLSHQPEEMPIGMELISNQTCDVAIASKYLSKSQVRNRSGKRRLISFLNSWLMRLVLNYRISDYSNGYRFYSRQAAEVLKTYKLRNGSPIYLSEALAIWLKSGLRVNEFPSTYLGRNEGSSKVEIIDLIKGILAVAEIGFRYHFIGFHQRK